MAMPDIRRRAVGPGPISTPAVQAADTSQLYQAYAQMAQGVSQAIGQEARRRREQQAVEAAGDAVVMGEDGNLRIDGGLKEGFASGTAYGRAFNERARAAYTARQEMAARDQAAQLREKYHGDPEGFEQAWQGYQSGLIDNSPDDALTRQAIEQSIGRIGAAQHRSLVSQRAQMDREQDAADLRARMEQAAQDAQSLAYTEGVESEEFTEQVTTFNEITQLMVADGLMSPEEAETSLGDLKRRMVVESAVGGIVEYANQNGIQAARQHVREVANDPAARISGPDRERFIARADARLSDMDTGQRMSRSRLNGWIENYTAMVEDGQSGPEVQRLRARIMQGIGGLPDADATRGEFVNQEQRAASFADMTVGMRQRPAGQMSQAVAALRPAPGREGEYKYQQETYERAQQRMRDIVAAREADPAAEAEKSFSAIAELRQRFQAEPTPDNYQSLLQARAEAQAQWNLSPSKRQLLTEAEIENWMGHLNNLAPAAREQWLGEIVQMGGPYTARMLDELEERGDMPPTAVMAGRLLHQGEQKARRAASLIFQGQAAMAEGNDSLTPPSEDIQDGINRMLDEALVQDDDRRLYQDAIVNVYAAMSRQDEDTSGRLNQERLERAANAVTGGIVDRNGRKTSAPVHGMSDDGFDGLVRGLDDDRLAQYSNGPPVTVDDEPVSIETIKDEGQMVHVGNGRYAVRLRSDGGFVANGDSTSAAGSMFVIDLRQAHKDGVRQATWDDVDDAVRTEIDDEGRTEQDDQDMNETASRSRGAQGRIEAREAREEAQEARQREAEAEADAQAAAIDEAEDQGLNRGESWLRALIPGVRNDD